MTATIPPPEYRYPDCPLCCQETWHDGDSLRCDNCHVYWNGAGEPGYRLDENIPQCPEETTGSLGGRYRCVLNAGHGRGHAGVRVDGNGGGVLDWTTPAATS